MGLEQAPLLAHLAELRKRLIFCVLFFSVLSLPFIIYAPRWYQTLTRPLAGLHGGETALIATSITAPFLVPLKFALVSAAILSFPFVLYQGWAFVAKGLYATEKKKIRPFMLASIVLFYAGLSMAYGWVCPMALRFFYHAAPEGVLVMAEMGQYLQFMLSVSFAFGVCFQVPLVVWAALQFGWLSAAQCRQARPFIIVGSFVVGMLLTPPDVISQIMLAIPMWALFELAVCLAPKPKPSQDVQPSHHRP